MVLFVRKTQAFLKSKKNVCYLLICNIHFSRKMATFALSTFHRGDILWIFADEIRSRVLVKNLELKRCVHLKKRKVSKRAVRISPPLAGEGLGWGE